MIEEKTRMDRERVGADTGMGARPIEGERMSRRELFEAACSGARGYRGQRVPVLRSDLRGGGCLWRAQSLEEFRVQEGAEREERLREIWRGLSARSSGNSRDRPRGREGAAAMVRGGSSFTWERAIKLQEMYESELVGRCRAGSGVSWTAEKATQIPWKEFYGYVKAKEAELWCIFHNELDLDGNGHLDSAELSWALKKAGIPLSADTLTAFMATLASSPHSDLVSFREFRDFLLLLPRTVSTAEIYQYYELKRYLGDDGRGAARLTMKGDVSLSGEDKPTSTAKVVPDIHASAGASSSAQSPSESRGENSDQEGHKHHNWFLGSTTVRYLLAGGIAGAVSRTCTAPFDRLKIFLITRPEVRGDPSQSRLGTKAIASAISKIYAENGVLGFWIGNGLSVVKILPESAIKFMTYETSKRFFAKYWDHVEDPREISQSSRFMSGGIGGIASQLSIYPIETTKTQMMSSAGGTRQKVLDTVKRVYMLGGVSKFYRGLIIGLVGVFPYSAIDMSTFEALKLTYVRSTGREEPGVLALLAFGSVSGSVGACSVYPLNLVRTRLQASGSPAHPRRYTGIWDVVTVTYKQSGVRGFYIGLGPTLAKVIPAVSISYVVYEHSKRRLGV